MPQVMVSRRYRYKADRWSKWMVLTILAATVAADVGLVWSLRAGIPKVWSAAGIVLSALRSPPECEHDPVFLRAKSIFDCDHD